MLPLTAARPYATAPVSSLAATPPAAAAAAAARVARGAAAAAARAAAGLRLGAGSGGARRAAAPRQPQQQRRRRRRGATAAAMAEAAPVPMEVPGEGQRGQPRGVRRLVILTLEEKKAPYEMKLVNTLSKPEWFLEANPSGKVPVVKHHGEWVADSDVIVDLLEKDYPEPSLSTPDARASVGSSIFGAFGKFAKSKEPHSDGTEANLLTELKTLEADLTAHPGPFVAGEKPTAVDLSLAPKLYALKVVSKHFKGFEVPADLTAVHAYIQALESMESFNKTKCTDEAYYAGWTNAGAVYAGSS